MEQKAGGSPWKWILIGCGGIIALGVIIIVGFGWWVSTTPESGVKLGNEMDKYALDYLAKNNLLKPGEEILAYYDVTMAMDGTEAAILTKDRVMYHKQGRTTEVRIQEVKDVRHRYESLIGDVIEIEDAAGRILKIEIAPFNQGETFRNALMSAWRAAKPQA